MRYPLNAPYPEGVPIHHRPAELTGSQLWVGLNEVRTNCPHCHSIISGEVIERWVEIQRNNAKPKGADPVVGLLSHLELENRQLRREIVIAQEAARSKQALLKTIESLTEDKAKLQRQLAEARAASFKMKAAAAHFLELAERAA